MAILSGNLKRKFPCSGWLCRAAFGTLIAVSPINVMGENLIASEMVDAHNQARARVGVGPLSWSQEIALSAQKWADELAQRNNCTMRHSHIEGLGENLYWASPVRWTNGRRDVQQVSPGQVVRSWEEENADYSYRDNSCKPGKVCGHYTQLVWADTTRVGCAFRICDDKGQIWVCQYGPPGNYVGQRPY